jgi:DNA-binding CsgD family transcriptional regulator/PAS domain-containing protein
VVPTDAYLGKYAWANTYVIFIVDSLVFLQEHTFGTVWAGMRRRTPEEPFKSSNRFEAPASKQDMKHLLLAALGHSRTIGFAVCDQRLRFQMVNEAWALMNGVAREAHMGVTIRDALGRAAKEFALAFEKVFSTGKPFLDYEFSAELPTRTEEGYWIMSCFPIKAAPGRLKIAGAVVLEITQLRRLEIWSQKLLADSVRLWEALCESDQVRSGTFPRTAELGTPIKGSHTEKISPREREIIQLLARSKSNKEVAAALAISVRTIETYRARIMLKLRIHSLSELVHYAIRNGIVEL